MTAKQRDLLTSAILFAFALAWTIITVRDIPGGFSPGDIGARGFPLFLGVSLAILSFGLGAKTLLVKSDIVADGEEVVGTGRSTVTIVIVLGHLLLYGFLMERIGFLLSTLVVTISLMAIGLRERNVIKILAFSAGTAVTAWLVFSKLMGVYLPMGTWITFG